MADAGDARRSAETVHRLCIEIADNFRSMSSKILPVPSHLQREDRRKRLADVLRLIRFQRELLLNAETAIADLDVTLPMHADFLRDMSGALASLVEELPSWRSWANRSGGDAISRMILFASERRAIVEQGREMQRIVLGVRGRVDELRRELATVTIAPRPDGLTATKDEPASTALVAPSHNEEIVVDEVGFSATYAGTKCPFTSRQKLLFDLFARLVAAKGRPISFDTLRETRNVWDGGRVEDSTIRSAIARLSKHLSSRGLKQVAVSITTKTFRGQTFVQLDVSKLQPNSN